MMKAHYMHVWDYHNESPYFVQLLKFLTKESTI